MQEYNINEDTKLRIVYDVDPMNPRTEWDNMCTMVCFHRRYNLGDKHDYNASDFNSNEEVGRQIIKDHDPAIIKPLYLYDHSGITISTNYTYPYNSKWDAGQVGWIFVSKETVRKEYGVKKITKKTLEKVERVLLGEVEVYDQYLCGDVYGFELIKLSTCDQRHRHEEVEDSCYGFYGHNIKKNGILDYLSSEHRKVIEAQL